MKSQLLLFLKGENYTDVDEVNAFFVTAFVKCNRLSVNNNRLLLRYLLHEDEKQHAFIDQLINKHSAFSLEDLTKLFEYVVSPADRIVTGAVYTPQTIRKTILHKTLGDKKKGTLEKLRIADISCGCGGFLMDVSLWIHKETGKNFADIFRENVSGIDIQCYAIERTKILLSLLALLHGEDENFEFNLLCRDTLDYKCEDWNTTYTGFDIIVGNPPYVCSRNLSGETLAKLTKYEVCSSGHPDLYIPFFQIAVEMLKDGGRLGYITMNTFLRSVNGRAIRNYFSQNRYSISVIDFRGYQVFDSRNTYTCLFYLDKQYGANSINYAVDERGILSNDIQYKSLQYSDLSDEKGWTLNDFDKTAFIESVGIQIKDFCQSRHGLATLSNETYIFKPISDDDTYFFLEVQGVRYPIEKEICRDIVNPNKLKSVEDLNLLIEKVIFPYNVDGGKAIIFTPDEMRNRFPMALAYLNAKKEVLSGRDKGDTINYPQWYAFGRTQSLVMPRYKLFFPKFANRPLRCFICDDPQLMFYNGLAFVNVDERKLRILKAVIESEMFWGYIQANAKPYASGYYSLSGVDIKHFGIPKFTPEEENELLALNNKSERERWLKEKYVSNK